MKAMNGLSSLQGELSEASIDWGRGDLSLWLQGLPVNKLGETCEMIRVAQQKLRQEQEVLSSEDHLQELDTLHTYVRLLDERIDKLYLDEAMPLSDYPQYCVESLIECYNNLGKAFLSLASEIITKQGQALALYFTLSSMTRSYQHLSAIYCQPDDGFWRMCYQVYSVAEAEGVLEHQLRIENRHETSINQLFKSFLLYCLCDLQQFRPREMRKIFSFLEQFSNQLSIDARLPGDQSKGIFAFNLDDDNAPMSLFRHSDFKYCSTVRYVDAASFARLVHQTLKQGQLKNTLQTGIKSSLLMRMLKTLAQVQSRQYKRTEAHRQCRGIIGFSHISGYLNKQSTGILFEKADMPNSGRYDVSRLELIADDEESLLFNSTRARDSSVSDDVWNKILQASSRGGRKGKIWDIREDESLDVEINQFCLLNSCAKGYGISIDGRTAAIKVGDLLAVVTEKPEKLELAIIRRLRRMEGGKFDLGVELIGLAEKVVVMKGGKKQSKAIFLPGMKSIKQPDTLIYNSSEFKPGEMISLKDRDKETLCRLDKITNSTLSFNQAELFYLE